MTSATGKLTVVATTLLIASTGLDHAPGWYATTQVAVLATNTLHVDRTGRWWALGVIVVRNASDRLVTWVEERRNLTEDFRRVFGRDPDEVRAVGLMSDTDQVCGSSETHLRAIRLARR